MASERRALRRLGHREHIGEHHLRGFVELVYDLNHNPSFRLIESLHARWALFLRHLAPEDFERGLMHPERGPMTVDRMVALYAWQSVFEASSRELRESPVTREKLGV